MVSWDEVGGVSVDHLTSRGMKKRPPSRDVSERRA